MAAKEITKQNGVLDLDKINLTSHYLRNESNLRFLCLCKPRNQKEKYEKQIIELGSEQLENDFNYRILMDRSRKCDFESTILGNLNIVNHKKFN